jgi:hypothetical protein
MLLLLLLELDKELDAEVDMPPAVVHTYTPS